MWRAVRRHRPGLHLKVVAMTRAKDQLMLVVPQRFYTHQQAKKEDRHLYAARTRFIPSSVVNHFDVKTWPVAAPGSPHGSHPSVPSLTVDSPRRVNQTSSPHEDRDHGYA